VSAGFPGAVPTDGPRAYRSITVGGSAFEMGVSHGRQAGDLIQASLALYEQRFRTENDLPWSEVLDLARGIHEAMARYDSELTAEIEGVAAGCGERVEAIVALNARTELLALARDGAPDSEDGCTAAACLPEATGSARVLLGRNWDQHLGLLQNLLVVAHEPETGPAMVLLTEAGILMREGLNEHGLGVTGNMLRCDQDGATVTGMPVSIIRRRILRHATLAPALREVFDSPRSHSINHLIAHAGGEAVDLEAAPRDVFWVQPDDGVLTHSNHFLDPRAAVTVKDHGPEQSPSTLYRHRRLAQRLRERHGTIDLAAMQDAFRDHFGRPDSVCSHPKGDPTRPPNGSVASIVMDLEQRTMWVAPHPVCEREYTAYGLP
jgi:isopenicillin-N N-acyltransferase like protein